MVRHSFQPVLWLLVLVQSIGLCHCLVVQASEAEYGIAAQIADGVAGSHQDTPAEQIACNTKVSVKAASEQTNLFVALVSPTLIEILPPPPCILAISVEPTLAPAAPHEGRNLPLLI